MHPLQDTRVGQPILFTVLFTVITMGSSQRATKKPFPLLYLYTEGLLNSTIAQGRRYGALKLRAYRDMEALFRTQHVHRKLWPLPRVYIHGSNAKCGSHAGGCNNNKKVYIKDLIQMNSRSHLFVSDQLAIFNPMQSLTLPISFLNIYHVSYM